MKNENINVEKLFSKGSKYIESTGNIWCKRKENLIHEWCISDDTERKNRINNIIKIIEDRIRIIAELHNIKKEEKIKAQIEADEMFVMLECPSFECRYGTDAYGTSIRYKVYEPGKLKCDKCGSSLREVNQINVDDMLLKVGIKI